MEQSTINLFRSDIRLPPNLAAISGKLRKAGIIVMTISIIVGLMVGSLAIILNMRFSDLTLKKDQTIKIIQSLANREILLTSVKDRANMASSIMNVQPRVAAIIDYVSRITPENWLIEISLNDQSTVTLDLAIDSVEEAVGVVSAASGEARQGHIANVIINSLKLTTEGKVNLSFSFVPVF